MDKKLLLVAFHNGVNSYLFIHKLYKQEPQTIAELVHSAQNFMNAKGAVIAKKSKRAERMEADLPCHPDQGPRPKKARMGEKKNNKKAGSSSEKSALHTLECSTWSSAYANQGWLVLEVAREDEERSK